MNSIVAILLACLISNNCLVASGTGVDVTTSGFSSMRNATIYSCMVMCVGLLSGLTVYICSGLLDYFGLINFSFIIAIVSVAIFVQIAEFIAKRCFPLFISQAKYFVPILASTCMLFMFALTGLNGSLLKMVLTIIASSVGMWFVLCLIAGIRKNCRYASMPETTKGNLMSLIIVFVLFLVWTM